jgi:hypothetical protein
MKWSYPMELSEPVEVVYAVGTQQIQLNSGQRVHVELGQHWPVDDPVVRFMPALFTRDSRYGLSYSDEKAQFLPDQYPPLPTLAEEAFEDAEQATAAPGEVRHVRRGRPPRNPEM